MRDVADFLTQPGARSPALLSPAEELRLLKRVELGDAEAKEQLILRNLRLVVSIAQRYRGHGVPAADLFREGALGLARAVDRFDWRLGFRLSTYATPWIRQACQRAVWLQGTALRPPLEMHTLLGSIRSVEQSLTAQLRRQPTLHELASATGAAVEEVRHALQMAQPVRSLTLDPELGDGPAELEVPTEHQPEPVEQAHEERRARVLREIVAALPEVERRVVELRHGLSGGEPLSLRETGRLVGFSRERARLLENDALSRIDRQLRNAAAAGLC